MKRTKPVDWTKPIQTVSGLAARVVCTDVKSDAGYPVIVLVTHEDGYESSQYYTLEGNFWADDGSEDEHDIVNVSEKKEGWINIRYNTKATGGVVPTTSSVIYNSEVEAKQNALPNTVATVKVKWEE